MRITTCQYLIFSDGLDNDGDGYARRRHRTLFAVCLFSAYRIRECSTLLTQDIYTQKGIVRPRLIIRKLNTKGKLATRSIPVID
ncbi:MAG: site-specific integrase [Nostoc sp.]|uniref:site-specific integrase n=1 Tax=Nostoc sp. TaxID=1180 RepID=UPI002FFA6B83